MRDKHYKSFSFRLSDKSHAKIQAMKETMNISYNILFAEMLYHYARKKKVTLKEIIASEKEQRR